MGALVALAVALVFCGHAVHAAPDRSPDGLWRRDPDATNRVTPTSAVIHAARFAAFTLDGNALHERLASAPLEGAATGPAVEITLPTPEGRFEAFAVAESPILEPALARRLPEVRTYVGAGVLDRTATLRCGWTRAGFHAQVLSARGGYCVDVLSRGDPSRYAAYRRDAVPVGGFRCALEEDAEALRLPPGAGTAALSSGGALRTYRLAMAATGEYSQFFGGATQALAAGIIPTINRVNGIYEREVAVRFVLVAGEDQIVYADPATDPFTFAAGTSGALDQLQPVLDATIGDVNYDVGHLVGQGGSGGVARLPCACQSGIKGRGTTSLAAPTGDAFDVDYVAHELGHQLGAHHTFNDDVSGSCAGNRSAAHAYEPGGGSTIMAYAGLCPGDDLQPHSDPYFHSESLDDIVAYTTSGPGSCPVPAATGNTPPTVSAGDDATIPAYTPFALTASGSDADGDALTYGWEQRDLGAARSAAALDDGFGPILRSFSPAASPTRTFPRLEDLVLGTTTLGEQFPSTDRLLHFRVTARDARAGGGGVATDDATLTVLASAGPFRVTAPVGGETWIAGAPQAVAWDVAGTDAAPIAATAVRIVFSTDGGLTYPVVLLASTPNDGGEVVVVPPCAATSAGRVRVEAVGNVFFAIAQGDVVVPGTRGPQVGVLAASSVLLAPPEDLRDVGLAVAIEDACATLAARALLVHASEPDDAVLTPDATFSAGVLSLRAQREALGGGRVYLAVATASDTLGDVGVGARAVVVPRLRTVAGLTALLVRASDAELAAPASGGAPPSGFTTILEATLP